ncbi:MAG: hypothetical protein ACLQLH_08630 [Terracidiphilus sp.]
MDKTLRRVTDLDEQQAENYRYWQNQTIGARLIAVSELSQEAYAFAAAFKGVHAHDEQGISGHPEGIQRSQS